MVMNNFPCVSSLSGNTDDSAGASYQLSKSNIFDIPSFGVTVSYVLKCWPICSNTIRIITYKNYKN